MKPLPILGVVLFLGCGLSGVRFAVGAEEAAKGTASSTQGAATPESTAAFLAFLKAHCFKCHGGKEPEGDVRLDDLTGDFAREAARWTAIRDQLRDGLMPPEDEPQPNNAKVREMVAWTTAMIGTRPASLPNQGNLIPHELLFGKPAATDGGASPVRLWRLSADGYMGFVRDVHRGRANGIVQPFSMLSERGIKDFSGLYAIDESSSEILLRNAAAIVEGQSASEFKDGKVQMKNDTIREFSPLMHPTERPTKPQLEAAISTQFRLAIGRSATPEETDRFLAFYEKCAAAGDLPAAGKTMLQAVLLRADAMYRSEYGDPAKPGTGSEGERGRKMLAPRELATALSLALSDRRERGIMEAAEKGELLTKEQAAAQVKRMLAEPKFEKPRILRFFREYFEYHKAVDVFKDKPKSFMHSPGTLVADTDRLVLHILEQDQDVFRKLLTFDRSFVNFTLKENKATRKIDVPHRVIVPHEVNNKGENGIEHVYGVASWSPDQPMSLPPETRLGILMQPSWLIAWSTNFENDPVRRGRWIRERLLGGTVPDLPIGVAAQVPDEPERTYRDRLQVTRDAMCWRCHRKMDDLGLVFENFDHFGRFRTTETVRDLEATANNVDKKGNPLGPLTKEVPLNISGLVADSGDPKLEGAVADPRALVRRLADSDRVRQVFIRHAFRCFLGRNESLADAQALQEADAAYVASGGSFQALLVSLLTSDPFLYRR